MMFTVRLTEEAEQDLTEAALWYERQRAGLGHQFLDNVTAALRIVASQPLLYPIVHRNTRRMLISRFPFGIFYRIEDSLVIVMAVMHGSRHPLRWRNRE